MSSDFLTFIPWLLFGFLNSGLLITSSVLLLRERHASAWLMLGGSVISLLGSAASHLLPLFSNFNGNSVSMQIYMTVGAFNALGSLTFAVGLLLHALNRRGQAARIAELEMILNSRNC